MKAKIYRFEAMQGSQEAKTPASDATLGSVEYEAIMAELKVLRSHLCPAEQDIAEGTIALRPNSNLQEALKLKEELDQIYSAIAQTKREIASISTLGIDETIARPTDELDAVVRGTENATNQILTAIEVVESEANTLANSLTGDAGLSASNIQEQIVAIYEACNFQDITGQRISKVVNVLKFISDRTDRMIEIWGGIDTFQDIEVDSIARREGDDTLLNGPALEDEEAVASQDDIDALFA